jgi:hypothetical protein
VLFPSLAIASDKPNDVEINLLSPQIVNTRLFMAELEISFHNPAYFNDQIYLSYHVFEQIQDQTPEAAILCDNQRIRVDLDKQGKANLRINMDLSKIKSKTFYVSYDIVDTKNLYWFQYKDDMNFSSCYTQVSYNRMAELGKPFTDAINNNLAILLFNVIVFICAIIIANIIVKKELLKFT